jgi:hypothetical protein
MASTLDKGAGAVRQQRAEERAVESVGEAADDQVSS